VQESRWYRNFFSYKGRAPRPFYWASLAMLVGLAVLNQFVVSRALNIPFKQVGLYNQGLHFGSRESLLVLLGSLPTWTFGTWCGNAILVKRLHDRGRSGYWVLLFVYAPWILGLYIFNAGRIWTWSIGIGNSVVTMVSLWGLIELGFLRGTKGSNRFGPDPVAGPIEASAN
jgi:uncharacterized membrane protein YhaH (DUF805 family)